MPIKLILAVGREPALLEYRSQILRRAGYIVELRILGERCDRPF